MDKKIILGLIVLLVFFLNNLAYSQSGWIPQNSGTFVDLEDVFFVNADTGWVVGYNGIIKKTINGGNTWTTQTSGIYERLTDIYFLNSNKGWIAGSNGTLLYTNNGGENWHPQLIHTSSWINAVFFINDTIGWIGCDSDTLVLKTIDGGNSWFVSFIYHWSDLIVSMGFFTENDGWGIFLNGIMKTVDGGANWSYYESSDFNNHAGFFLNDTLGWVTGSGGNYKTTDGGNTWDEMELYGGNDIYFIDQNTGWLAGFGVAHTTDGGLNWQVQDIPVDDIFTSLFFIDYTTGWIVGYNGTILKTTTGGASSIQENTQEHSIPVQYSLSQNFPNPFNPSTTIYYSLPKSDNVKLKIYDLLGKEIVSLVNDYQTAGEYEITWQQKGLSSGIYFYRLQAGDFSETKKLIFRK